MNRLRVCGWACSFREGSTRVPGCRVVLTRSLSLWLIVSMALPVALAEAQSRPATPDSTRLQGHWLLVEGSVDGQGIPPAIRQGMRRTMTGTHLLVAMGTQTFLDASVTLHPDTRPAAIDYRVASPSPGGLQLGIYRWVGDTIEFCFARLNQPRPSAFGSATGDGRTWTRWVRAP